MDSGLLPAGWRLFSKSPHCRVTSSAMRLDLGELTALIGPTQACFPKRISSRPILANSAAFVFGRSLRTVFSKYTRCAKECLVASPTFVTVSTCFQRTPSEKDLTLPSLSMENLEELDGRLRRLRLPTMRSMAIGLADRASLESWSHLQFLDALLIAETDKRKENRIARHMKRSELECSKAWS